MKCLDFWDSDVQSNIYIFFINKIKPFSHFPDFTDDDDNDDDDDDASEEEQINDETEEDCPHELNGKYF